MNVLNKELVKSQIPALQLAIQEHLKVDAGKQAAYHLFAVAHFFKNDNELKGSFEKSQYSLSTNFGTSEYPCIIKHDLGLFKEDYQAMFEAEDFLRTCQKNITWKLLKNNEDTGKTLDSKTRPEKGLIAEITLEGEKFSDLVDHLDNIKDQLENEISQGRKILPRNMHDYSFSVAGDEYDFINDVDCFVSGKEFIIFDASGIVEDGEEEDVDTIWVERESAFDEWSEFLIHAQLVELEDALEDDEKIYHAISSKSKTIYSGEILDILDALKYSKIKFSLYVELERN